MARKKTTETQAETAPDQTPSEDQAAATVSPPPAQHHPQGNGAREPDVRWSVQSDKSTRIDVECFVNRFVTQSGEGYEQVSTVVTRSFLGQDGNWVRHGSWRTHDIPVLQFLLAKAHAFALDRRTQDSGLPF
jgi:hypothetical protein